MAPKCKESWPHQDPLPVCSLVTAMLAAGRHLRYWDQMTSASATVPASAARPAVTRTTDTSRAWRHIGHRNTTHHGHAKLTKTMIIIVIKLHSVQCVVARVDVPVYDGRSRQCWAAGDRNRGKTRDIWTRVTSQACQHSGEQWIQLWSTNFYTHNTNTHISGYLFSIPSTNIR